MALQPVLKLKVDELFLRWLSERETQALLRTNLKQVRDGRPVSTARSNWAQSPRLGGQATPPTSPSSAKMNASPRSPRRSMFSKSRQLQTATKSPRDLITQKQFNEAAPPQEPASRTQDNKTDSFLRQKEAQLRERRERERLSSSLSEQTPTPPSTADSIKPATPELRTNDQKVVSQSKTKSAVKKPSLLDNQTEKVTPKPDAKEVPSNNLVSPADKSTVDNKVPQKNKTVVQKPLDKQSDSSSIPSKPGTAVPSRGKEVIPQFYFPKGTPVPEKEKDDSLQRIKDCFASLPDGKVEKQHLEKLAKACGLPLYWKILIWVATDAEKNGHIKVPQFLVLWKKLLSNCPDNASKFLFLLAKPGSQVLVPDDFVSLIQDVVETHPGLTFLQEAPEFHSRYVHTVIARIFYTVNRSWSGKITAQELRRSNFLQTVDLLEQEDDINQISVYFSYEHFYVIYCKFWELDKDHDLLISKEDLAKHNDHAISGRMIDRIFSGAVTKGRAQKEGKMTYSEFVWFLIAEEDKHHPTSVEYWFRCMDLDGDGIISMYEMEYFYEEMVQRMEAMGIETLPFEDCLCQMLDMIKPRNQGMITLADIKASKMTPLFFDTFFNIEKYLDHEQKDPFANVKEGEEAEVSDWERYAAEEYEILVAEEGAAEVQHDEIAYEDDFEPDDDALNILLDNKDGRPKSPGPKGEPAKHAATTDDIYDFSSSDLGY